MGPETYGDAEIFGVSRRDGCTAYFTALTALKMKEPENAVSRSVRFFAGTANKSVSP
jgi:hypothetical protein